MLPPAIVITRWFQRRSSAAQLEVRNRIAAVTAHLAESVAGMAVVQSFRREPTFRARFDELNLANREANVFAQRISSMFFPSIEFLGVIATVAVLALGAGLLPPEEIGTLAAAYFLLALVFQPLQELSDLYSQLQSATAAMVKVSTVLDTEPEIRSPERPRQIGTLDGRVEFDGVVFAYGSNEVLHGIDLVIPEGGCTALVGESGGGKSTLAKLAARFYDPLEGAMLRRRHGPARARPARATAASSASCCRTRSCSRARSPTTSASRTPTRATTRSPRRRRCSVSTGSPGGSPRASTTRCARAAAASPPASAS